MYKLSFNTSCIVLIQLQDQNELYKLITHKITKACKILIKNNILAWWMIILIGNKSPI